MSKISELWVKHIKSGAKTLDDVPEKLRAEVEQLVSQTNAEDTQQETSNV